MPAVTPKPLIQLLNVSDLPTESPNFVSEHLKIIHAITIPFETIQQQDSEDSERYWWTSLCCVSSLTNQQTAPNTSCLGGACWQSKFPSVIRGFPTATYRLSSGQKPTILFADRNQFL